MTVAPARHVVVVDGSNLATEGRTTPSLRQLDEAVRAYAAEDPAAEIVVVVDASFEHRIDPSERTQLIDAGLHGEVVSPPAGAIGRGDAFVLRIAERTGASVLSNDSFQEFHAEHPWLFDKGRLVGGKPVPGVGWIFTPRIPVRGPRSRQAQGRAKGEQARVLSPPVKAAELAKAAKKLAARRAPVLPDGSTPKVGDVWPQGTLPAAGTPAGTGAKTKKVEPARTGRKAAKAKAEEEGAATAVTGDGAAEAPPAPKGRKAVAKVAPAKSAAKKEAAGKAAAAKGTAKKAAAKKAAADEELPERAAGKKKQPEKAAANEELPEKAAANEELPEKAAAKKRAAAAKAAAPAKPAAKKAQAAKPSATKATATKATATKSTATEAAPARPVARMAEPAAKKATARKGAAKKSPAPVTTDGTAKAARSTAAKDPVVQEAIGQALAEAIAPVAEPAEDGRTRRGDDKREKRKPKDARQRRRRAASPPPAVNEPLAFITFVATYPLERELEGEVVSFTSHGAMVDVELPGGGVLHSYIPLAALGDPPPTKARQVLTRGERRRFVLVALDPPRRVAELALPEIVASQRGAAR